MVFNTVKIQFDHNIEKGQKIKELIESNPNEHKYKISKTIYHKNDEDHLFITEHWIKSFDGLVEKNDIEKCFDGVPIIKFQIEEDYANIILLFFTEKNDKNECKYIEMNASAYANFSELEQEKKFFYKKIL